MNILDKVDMIPEQANRQDRVLVAIYFYLNSFGRPSGSEVAALLNMTRQGVARHISTLTDQGFLEEREPASHYLMLTPKGQSHAIGLANSWTTG